jgi:hypothetical protein
VDISDGLLHLAVREFSSRVAVPLGILGDFEDGNGFIGEQLESHAVRPLVIGLLGNTLGNLDRRENIFLHDVRQLLKKDDFLLLDVSLVGKNWTWESDRKTDPTRYLDGDKRFLATSICKIAKVSFENAMANFSDLVRVSPGTSDVPGAHTITIRHTTTGRPICNVRRYNFDTLKNWLSEKSFELVYESAFFDDREVSGDAVLLLKPRRPRIRESG